MAHELATAIPGRVNPQRWDLPALLVVLTLLLMQLAGQRQPGLVENSVCTCVHEW